MWPLGTMMSLLFTVKCHNFETSPDKKWLSRDKIRIIQSKKVFDPKWCISCLHSAQLICLWGPASTWTSPIATSRILSVELVNILIAWRICLINACYMISRCPTWTHSATDWCLSVLCPSLFYVISLFCTPALPPPIDVLPFSFQPKYILPNHDHVHASKTHLSKNGKVTIVMST